MIPRPYLRKGAQVQYSDEIIQKHSATKDRILAVVKTYHQWVYVLDPVVSNDPLIINCDDLQGVPAMTNTKNQFGATISEDLGEFKGWDWLIFDTVCNVAHYIASFQEIT